MLSLNNNITNPNFKQKSGGKIFNPPPYSANQFITDLNKEEEKRLNGGFLSKTIGSPTHYCSIKNCIVVKIGVSRYFNSTT